MPSEAVARVLSKLPDAKRSGTGWKARCRAHEDRNPSLSISQGDDGHALVHCHAGCATENIVGALGLTMADLMSGPVVASKALHRQSQEPMPLRKPPPSPQPMPTPTSGSFATAVDAIASVKGNVSGKWEYVNEHGNLIGYIVRIDKPGDKDYRPVSLHDERWLVKAMPDPRPLYRLPDLAKADDVVFVCEGEKAADAVCDVGLVATTSSGGSAAPGKTDWAMLAGKRVCILPDNDKAGDGYATKVLELLSKLEPRPVVSVVKLPGLPAGGDAVEFIADLRGKGQTNEQIAKVLKLRSSVAPVNLDDIATETPGRSLVMRSGLDIDDPPTSYLWKNRLVRGAVNIIFSRPGRGKSTLGAYLTAKVTKGGMWADKSWCEQGHVFYLKGEGSDRSIADRMDLAGADPSKYHIIGRADDDDSPMIDLANDIPLVAAGLAKFPETKLVIVDTLSTMYPSMKAIDNAHIGRCLWPMQQLAEQFNLAVVIFAHTNKGQYLDPLERLSGGRAIGGVARAIWYLGKADEDADECCMACVKANDFLHAPTLSYAIRGISADKPGVTEWVGEVDTTAWELDRPKPSSDRAEKAERCRTWLADKLANGPIASKDILQWAVDEDFRDHVMSKARRELGVVAKSAKGRMPSVSYYCLPGQEPPDLSAPPADTQLSMLGGPP